MNDTTATGLVLSDVALTLNGRRILDDLSVRVAPGEIVVLMGPSGCGKSSLLAYLSGSARKPLEGRGTITLDGRRIDNLPPERRQVGILFQDDLLFSHMTVAENLMFGMPRSVRGRRERARRASAALAEIGLAGLDARDPLTLSGGQRARVALMRALLAEPKALLLDEPFTGLDETLRGEIRALAFAHARKAGLPVLMVSHDRDDARAAGGRVLEPWNN